MPYILPTYPTAYALPIEHIHVEKKLYKNKKINSIKR